MENYNHKKRKKNKFNENANEEYHMRMTLIHRANYDLIKIVITDIMRLYDEKRIVYLHDIEVDGAHELCGRCVVELFQTVKKYIVTHAMRSMCDGYMVAWEKKMFRTQLKWNFAIDKIL